MKWAEVGYYEGLINRGWVIYINRNGNFHGGARSWRLAMEDDELEAMRAHFPLSFGKSSIVSPPTESIHSATRRADAGASSDSKPNSGFPSLSNSWIQSVRRPKRNPNSSGGAKSSLSPSEDDVSVSVEDDGVMVGPPPPPPARDGNDSDDEDDMIGPPPPPPPRTADVDSDDDDDEENRYKIPLSNEIQLKGHTKV